MDVKWQLVCYIVALICFVIAALEPWFPEGRRPHLIAAGLAFWVLVPLSLAWEAV